IVILGGGDERLAAPEYGGEPAPGPVLLERIAYGAFLAHRTALPVLVSGTAAEALAMRVSLARDFGIQVRWVEERSRDTFQNAQFSSRLLKAAGVSRILLEVPGLDAPYAIRHLLQYEAENRAPPPPPPPPRVYPHAWVGCVLYVAVLIGVAAALSGGLVRLDAFDLGVLDA